jgi:hypothetical protein
MVLIYFMIKLNVCKKAVTSIANNKQTLSHLPFKWDGFTGCNQTQGKAKSYQSCDHIQSLPQLTN